MIKLSATIFLILSMIGCTSPQQTAVNTRFAEGMMLHDKGVAEARFGVDHYNNVYTTLDNPDLTDEVKQQKACDYASNAISPLQLSSTRFIQCTVALESTWVTSQNISNLKSFCLKKATEVDALIVNMNTYRQENCSD
jgi:hypothetical protein